MKIKLFILFLIICCNVGLAQQVHQIFIYNKAQQAIEDANVSSIDNLYHGVTNQQGFVKIPIENLNQIFIISRMGFQDFSTTITITDTILYLDSIINILDEIKIYENKSDNLLESQYLKNVEDMSIFAAKKTDLILPEKLNINLARNSGRQLFAKIAGLNIWESDASGLQLDVATRGLEPTRTSNFNLRQNGYDISADALGYPDAYYLPPSEAIDKIEIVRGAAGLQYGTQFGGMINFKLKPAVEDKPYHFNIQQTAGSYGFSNTFFGFDGTYKKLSYHTFYQFRRGNSFRPNSLFKAHNYYFKLKYQINEKASLAVEYSGMQYLAHQPGGLTDAQFNDNPNQSSRTRNWFAINWNLLNLEFRYKFNNKLSLQSNLFTLLAGRDAIGNLSNIQQNDILNTPRNLLSDSYKNIGNETRLLYKYKTTATKSFVFLVGARVYRGHTTKKQDDANAGSDANFEFLTDSLISGSDFKFPSTNVALFAEHLFTFNKFSITPGFRYEFINTTANGFYKDRYVFNDIVLRDTTIYESKVKNRHIFLLGLGLSYKVLSNVEIYANLSQNYRAINFNDIRTNIPGLRVNPNLKDEKGYSFDIGLRGTYKNILNYNIGSFCMIYNDRISEVNKKDTLTLIAYRYRTNVAKSRALGVDVALEVDFLKFKNQDNKFGFKWYNNLAYLQATYIQSDETTLVGNTVEYAPKFIYRSGLAFSYQKFIIGVNAAYISEQFTEATNAVQATPNAIAGLVPSYYTIDFNTSYTYKWFTFKVSGNNITNHKYFTRRAAGYPGPGIIPAEAMSWYGTIIFNW